MVGSDHRQTGHYTQHEQMLNQCMEIARTVAHSGNHIMQSLQQNRLVNRVSEPGVDQGLRVQGGIYTNAAARGDSLRPETETCQRHLMRLTDLHLQVDSDGEYLTCIVRHGGIDGRSSRANSSLGLADTRQMKQPTGRSVRGYRLT